jgi:hypothetical protein
MGCGRQWCTGCREELIHRDHRKAYESASALGQIVGREGPLNLSVTDVDLASWKRLRNGAQLLYFVEQKNPGHELRSGQQHILRLWDHCIEHCIACPDAAHLQLDRRSGLILVRGHIASATEKRRETCFRGPQTVQHVRSGLTKVMEFHEEFFRLLDPEDSRRRHGIGWKRAS